MGAERELGALRTRVKGLNFTPGKMDLKLVCDVIWFIFSERSVPSVGRDVEQRHLLCAGGNGSCTNAGEISTRVSPKWTLRPSNFTPGVDSKEVHVCAPGMLIVAPAGPKCPSAGERANALCCILPGE